MPAFACLGGEHKETLDESKPVMIRTVPGDAYAQASCWGLLSNEGIAPIPWHLAATGLTDLFDSI